jgi:hypothetical protein
MRAPAAMGASRVTALRAPPGHRRILGLVRLKEAPRGTLPALRPGVVDAILYGTSATVTAFIATGAGITPHREWARVAVGPYAAAAVVSLLIARRGPATRLRTWIALAVFVTAALAPLAIETTRRSHSDMGRHAQSEAIIVEEAAKAMLDGRDPYAATYLRGPLAERPLATKTHFPYLPGMVLFGLPRALDGRSPLADARVWFALATVAAAGAALLSPHPWFRAGDRLLVFQVLAVLPTGALAMATGGDDVPVLALMLLALVLMRDGRLAGAGLAAGAAAALKQTAWILLPFLLVATMAGRARRRTAAAFVAVALPAIVPFVLWNPWAFIEDAIRFPLGIGRGQTVAATPTVGSALVHAFPSAKVPLTILLVTLVGAIGTFALARRPPRSASAAAGTASIVLVAGLLLAPAARVGYLVYPIDLAVWAFVLRSVHSGRGGVPDP